MVAMDVLSAKAKKTLVKIAPAGTGKSAASDTVKFILQERAHKYTSLTLAGLKRLEAEFNNFSGHIIIDDLAAEKSMWSRISTINVLSNLVYSHYVHKISQTTEIKITDFFGSASMNIQPVLMNNLVQGDDWVAIMRDKMIRYYHLYRPGAPKRYPPSVKLDWGPDIRDVTMTARKGKLWYHLVAIALTQWSYARVEEHLPDLLKATAALDGRERVTPTDYRLLIKILKPMQLERYLIKSFGLETGRLFQNNLYCILVEIASFGEPTVEQICEDYKVSPATVDKVVATLEHYCFVKSGTHRRIAPTDVTKEMMEICGTNQRW